MPSQSHSPPMARCLLVAILIALGFLAAVILSDGYSPRLLQKLDRAPEDDQSQLPLEKRLLGMGGVAGLVPSLLGNVVPGGIVSSLVAQVTADIDSLLPVLDDPGAQSPSGIPLVTGGQDALPLTAEPLPTGAQLGGLADKLGSLLNGIVPVAAPSIISAITEQAFGVVSSVEAIATDVASLGNQIASSQIHAPDALSQIGGLLSSLDSKVNDIVNGVTSDLSSDIPLPVLQDLNQVISSGLGDIIGAANGPLSLVGDLVEQNVCGAITLVDGVLATVAGLCGDIPSAVAQVSSEIATAPLTNPDATLTGDVFASTIFSNPTSTGGLTTTPISTLPTQGPQNQGTLTNPITSNSVSSPSSNLVGTGLGSSSPPPQQPPSNVGSGFSSLSATQMSSRQSSISSSIPEQSGGILPTPITPLPTTTVPLTSMPGSAQPGQGSASLTPATSANGITTVTEYRTMTQSCTSNVIQSMVTQTVTLTVSPPCPTSPCTAAPRTTCNCPNSNPTPSGGKGAKGPCPGTGYTCDDCLDGWFCPPSQTPAQSAPCGFGWPCAHCEGGWFCAPLQTSGPCMGSSVPTVTSPGTTAASGTSFASTTPRSSAPGQPRPPPPEKVRGWSHCGCWADGLNQRALNTEVFSSDLLTNEDCIQHCIVRGFIMAGTENGNSCLCGNFLNSTQEMDESVCSMPCAGDVTQMCGGLNALSCYSPDGQPYGWASAGPQLRSPTIIPPTVLELNIGGVAQTEIMTPAIIFPPQTVNPESLIDIYGKFTSQPLGDLPRGLTIFSPNAPSSSTPPFGGSQVAPGQNSLPGTLSNSQTPSATNTPGDSTRTNATPSLSNTPNSPTPGIPVTHTTPDSLSPPGSPGFPGISGSSTSPNGNGSVAPGVIPPTPSTTGESIPSPSNWITPTESGANPTSNNPGSSSGTNPLSNPSESLPGTTAVSSSTSDGTGGVAPLHGSTSYSTSFSIIIGGPSSTPGQTQGPTSPGGGASSSSTSQLSNGGFTSESSSSFPPGGASTFPTQNGSSITCTPGSSDLACISSNPSQSMPPGQSQSSASSTTCSPGSNGPICTSPVSGGAVAPGQQQPSTSPSGNVPSTCTSGSTDPSCTSPVSGGAVAPGQQHPSTSTPGGVPSTCTSGSTDPSCTSPVGGANPNQPSSPTSSTSSNSPTAPGGSTSQTHPSGAPSGTSVCTPGSTDLNCSAPGNGGSFNPSGAPGQSTPPTLNPITSALTTGSTPTGDGGSTGPSDTGFGTPSTANGSGSLTTTGVTSSLPPSINGNTVTSSSPPGQIPTSPPGGAGSVAPGQQSPNSQPTQSNTQISGTNSNPSEGSNGSITPTGTVPNLSPPNGGTPSPGSPGQPTASNPNQSQTPNSDSTGPQTSYTYPPGVVPYGGPSPSMRTIASMLAWREPDGAVGAPTMLHPAVLRDSPGLPREAPMLDYEPAPTTGTSSSKLPDPRWQRIRPVYIW